MKSDPIKPTLSPEQSYELQWTDKFNELCYKALHQNPDGAQLLAHLENRFFRSPVANPNKEPAWAFFQEGFNECIRKLSLGVQSHIVAEQRKTETQSKPKKPII